MINLSQTKIKQTNNQKNNSFPIFEAFMSENTNLTLRITPIKIIHRVWLLKIFVQKQEFHYISCSLSLWQNNFYKFSSDQSNII